MFLPSLFVFLLIVTLPIYVISVDFPPIFYHHSPFHSQLQQANSMKEHKITAKQLLENNECEEAIPFLTEAIEVSPWNLDLREMRADCYEMTGNFQSAISDIKWAIFYLRCSVHALFLLMQDDY